MKYAATALLCLFTLAALCQPAKKTITENRIKCVITTNYNEGGKKNYTEKRYYSVKGYDSIVYFDDMLSFKYKPILNSKGKVKRLTRFTDTNKEDEVHLYEYKKDGSYTIEIIAQGAGTIVFSEYNSAGDCVGEIFDSSDTLIYSNISKGFPGRVQLKENGVLTELTTTEFDKQGYPIAITTASSNPVIVRFKNNTMGLPVEKRAFNKNPTGEKEMGDYETYAYEFY